jgi:glycogen synthase
MHLQESQTLKYLLKHTMEKGGLYFSKIIFIVNKGDTLTFTCMNEEGCDNNHIIYFFKD